MGKDQELIEAARNGDEGKVEKILNQRAKRTGPLASLRRGPGANAQDSQGYTALHHAAVHKHREIVKLLLTHEANINVVDSKGLSSLHLAAWSGDEEIVRLLLTHGPSVPNVNLKNKSAETPLHLASQHGHGEIVRLLLQHGADPSITNMRNETPLDLASQYGRLETVRHLLQAHPELLAPYMSPNRSLFAHTPLHLASKNGHRKTVESLVEAGFNVNTRTADGTALHEAALCGKIDVVRALLDAGIDVCVTDCQRRTAVDRVQEVGLKTPVAMEIADLIRGALKKTNALSGKSISTSPAVTPHESISITADSKVPLRSLFDNCSPGKDDTLNIRHSSYSPRQSPKNNYFIRGKTRRSMDAFVGKGPELQATTTAPPKKPPRRNLSASPTHPGINNNNNESLTTMMTGGGGENSEGVFVYPVMGRNKSLDESMYSETWRKSVPTFYEVSETGGDSSGTSSLDFDKTNNFTKGDDARELNGSEVVEVRKGVDSLNNFVSVAHIKLRDAKNEVNVSSPRNVRLGTENNNVVKKTTAVENVIRNGSQLESGKGAETVNKKPLPRGPKPAIAPKPTILPKPKNIKRQGNSCDNVLDDDKAKSSSRKTPKSTSMSTISPVEIDKEWESILQSLDTQMGELNTLQRRKLKQASQSMVGSWLSNIGMGHYEKVLMINGFDNIEFLGEDVLDDVSLIEIGVLNAQERKVIVKAANKLQVRWPRTGRFGKVPESVDGWLEDLHLPQYKDTFRKNLYADPDRLVRLLNDELITVLDINLVGHRRRILCASCKITGEMSLSRSSSSTRLENGGNSSSEDLRTLAYREPKDLVSGVSSALKTAWRHTPETLIDGSVAYRAIYVGSSSVQEFSTPDLIQGAIQSIRSQHQPKLSGAGRGKPVTTFMNIRVTLIVSATVVSWYDAQTQNLVKEHEIGSIQCTCQASDDLRHLALVTKAADPRERHHSCHVFCLDSVELATEAILTLGQAFEVAYQLAVNRNSGRDYKGHTRSKSANQLCPVQVGVGGGVVVGGSGCAKIMDYNNRLLQGGGGSCGGSHLRSQSVTDIPPVPVVSGTSSSQCNSPRIQKSYGLPRAESFSFSSHSSLSRAPIVSKEEL